jgi:predicted kinase
MDLDHYGRADLAHYFIEAYAEHSRDEQLKELLKFYKCYRACVRGKVACFQLDDPYIAGAEKERIRDVAAGYFDLGAAYARPRPLLAITVGLTGTGKSALARELARRFGLAVISSDVTRKQLAGITPTEHRFEEFSSGIYTAEFSRLTYDAMFTEAARFLGGDVPEIAQQTGADFLVIECTLDEAAIRERLERRRTEVTASDGRPEVLEFQQGIFEPVVEAAPGEHVIIDTSPPVEKLVDELRSAILG